MAVLAMARLWRTSSKDWSPCRCRGLTCSPSSSPANVGCLPNTHCAGEKPATEGWELSCGRTYTRDFLMPSTPERDMSCRKTSTDFVKTWCRLSTIESRVWASPGETSWVTSFCVVQLANSSLHEPLPSSVHKVRGTPKWRAQHLSTAWIKCSVLSPVITVATWYLVAMSTIERTATLRFSVLIHMTSAWTASPNSVGCIEVCRCWFVGFAIAKTSDTSITSCSFQHCSTCTTRFQDLNQGFSGRMSKVTVETLNRPRSFLLGVSHQLNQVPKNGSLFIHHQSMFPELGYFRDSKTGSEDRPKQVGSSQGRWFDVHSREHDLQDNSVGDPWSISSIEPRAPLVL